MKKINRLFLVLTTLAMLLSGFLTAGCARTSHKKIMSNLDGITGATLKP